MIKVSGATRRSFVFPAELPIAYAYYGDVGRLLNYLPHLCLVRAYGPDQFRLLYSTTELGVYQVHIFADVQTRLDEGWVLRIQPLDGIQPVRVQTGIHSSTTQGLYSSESFFREAGDQTRIDYSLQLEARLPTPLALRFMPGLVVNRIAKSITNMRIREIAEGFIAHSIAAFPHWLAEMENPRSLIDRLSLKSLPREDASSPPETG
jgi:hypothetical protein